MMLGAFRPKLPTMLTRTEVTRPTNRILVFGACAILATAACSSTSDSVDFPEDTGDEGAQASEGEGEGEGAGEGEGEGEGGEGEGEPEPTFGAPAADPVALNHAAVVAAVRRNVTQHFDELDEALTPVEDSTAVSNLIDLLPFGDDDEDEDEGEGEGPEGGEGEGEGEGDGDDDEGLEIDLSEVRDGILELLTEDILVESAATPGADGMSVTYRLVPDPFCNQDPEEDEEDESEERAAERAAE